jgi:hypothetical protein
MYSALSAPHVCLFDEISASGPSALHPSRTFAAKPGDGGFGEAVPFAGKTG